MRPGQKRQCPAATGHSANQQTDGAIFNEIDAERKRFDTLAARAALADAGEVSP